MGRGPEECCHGRAIRHLACTHSRRLGHAPPRRRNDGPVRLRLGGTVAWRSAAKARFRALYSTKRIDLQISFSAATRLGIAQVVGLGFLFVPITMSAYVGDGELHAQHGEQRS